MPHLIHVATQLSIPATKKCIPDWRLERTEHRFTMSFEEFPRVTPDAIVMMGVGAMRETEALILAFPNVPLFVYHWDCYSWTFTNPRPGEYDYKKYAELLRRAVEVWVPSATTRDQAMRYWSLPRHKFRRIHSAAPTWKPKRVIDNRYLLCCLRELPDPMWSAFEDICKRREIPYLMTGHEYNFEDYKKAVAECSGIVSHMNELSTGGLSILEAYAIGKPVLLNGHSLHGGRDYLGGRARYFYGIEDFEKQLVSMYKIPETVSPDSWDWVATEFSDARMIQRIAYRIENRIERMK
tara:strand:- start:16586 stop:17470 length:885 start_codon:yes stop_codon:yes gene_type:complete